MTIWVDHVIERALRDRTLKIEPWSEWTKLNPASVDLTLGNMLKIAKTSVYSNKVRISPWRADPDLHWYDFDMIPPPGLLQGAGYGRPWLTYQESGVLGGQLVPGYILQPGQFVLGHTAERVSLPPYVAGRVEGKSSLGRWGLIVHVTAGFIDPGFEGQITLELCNVSDRQIILEPGRPISQICFYTGSAAARHPYKGKYQGQVGVQAGKPDEKELKRESVVL